MLMHGADLRTQAEILGHMTMSMVMRYPHLLDEHKKKTIQLLDGLGF
jgi:site-specific recombinase XerD